MLYIITYATANAEQRNEALEHLIQSYPDWAILNNSTFIIHTDDNINAVMTSLKECISAEQHYRLFIGRIAPPLSWRGFANGFEEWVDRVFSAEYRPNTPANSRQTEATHQE